MQLTPGNVVLLGIKLVPGSIREDGNRWGFTVVRQLVSIPLHLLFIGIMWAPTLNVTPLRDSVVCTWSAVVGIGCRRRG